MRAIRGAPTPKEEFGVMKRGLIAVGGFLLIDWVIAMVRAGFLGEGSSILRGPVPGWLVIMTASILDPVGLLVAVGVGAWLLSLGCGPLFAGVAAGSAVLCLAELIQEWTSIMRPPGMGLAVFIYCSGAVVVAAVVDYLVGWLRHSSRLS
jgi:hypothetical protein